MMINSIQPDIKKIKKSEDIEDFETNPVWEEVNPLIWRNAV